MTKSSVFIYLEDSCKINPYSNGPKTKKEIILPGRAGYLLCLHLSTAAGLPLIVWCMRWMTMLDQPVEEQARKSAPVHCCSRSCLSCWMTSLTVRWQPGWLLIVVHFHGKKILTAMQSSQIKWRQWKQTVHIKGEIRPCLDAKFFWQNTSHRMFGHMHGVLNEVYLQNFLHGRVVNSETNLMSLLNSWFAIVML